MEFSNRDAGVVEQVLTEAERGRCGQAVFAALRRARGLVHKVGEEHLPRLRSDAGAHGDAALS